MSVSIIPDSVYTTSLETSNSSIEKREQWNLIADRCVKLALALIVAALGLSVVSTRVANISLQISVSGYLACGVFATYAWIKAARS